MATSVPAVFLLPGPSVRLKPVPSVSGREVDELYKDRIPDSISEPYLDSGGCGASVILEGHSSGDFT